MPRAVHARSLTAVLILLSACTASVAGTYRCTNGNTRYYSDKPCPSGDLRFMGPSGDSGTGSSSYGYGSGRYRGGYQSPEVSVARAPEHMKYLSAECAQLNDAIRTGPTRGVGWGVIGELRREYEHKCRDEDREARSQLSNDEAQVRAQKMSNRVAREQEMQAAQAKASQCNAIRDVIQTRRRRLDTLSPKEVAAFHDTEAAFNERCLGR